jgi:glycosyltransferase involved in cell wall biosynthesis
LNSKAEAAPLISPLISKRMTIGLYLGVLPSAGGMFQYGQCILEALAELQGVGYGLVVAYGDQSWHPILKRSTAPHVQLKNWKLGERIASYLMAAHLPSKMTLALSAYINPLIAEMAALKCDLWVFPAQDALSWQVEGKTISTIHDLMHRYERRFPEAGSWLRYVIREHRFRNLAKCSAILVDSETGRQQVCESYGTPGSRIFVLPYIAPKHILSGSERADFEQHYPLPKKYFFYPAQFWPHKNHLRLLEAFAGARQNCPDLALVLSGGRKHDFPKVKARVQELGLERVVHFLGYVPNADLAGIYRRARGLIMPTFFGPTNIPPLEAMACACPVMVSDIYGMREQCGDAALYFDPASADQIRDAMESLWKDDALYDRLAVNGRKRAAIWGQCEFNSGLSKIVSEILPAVPPPG